MAIRQKWDINGKGTPAASGGMGWTGPDLPKGSWRAKIKRMEITKIAAKGENHGKPRIRVLLEVTGMTGDKAKYNGHPIWDGLNIITSSVPFVNGFLHGLTDGSEKQKRAIEAAFWDEDKGPERRRVKVEKGKNAGTVETHIIKIGRVPINSPKGETIVQVTTRPGTDQKGNYRAEVTGYIPLENKAVDEDVEDGDDVEDDDMLEDAADDEDEDDEDDGDGDGDDEDEEDEDEDEDDEDEDEDEDEDAKEPATAGGKRRPF